MVKHQEDYINQKPGDDNIMLSGTSCERHVMQCSISEVRAAASWMDAKTNTFRDYTTIFPYQMIANSKN